MARISESFQASLGAPLGRATRRDSARTARSIAASESELDIDLAASATVNAQFWLNRFPLRPTAGWAILAALLSAGFLQRPAPVEWSMLVLLWLLADPLWGGIWRLAGGRTEILPLRERDLDTGVWLPYFEQGSPAAMLLGSDRQGVLHLLFRVGFPTVALALVIALVLGPTAVWMTLALLAISALGWISRHTVGVAPAMFHSLVTIVLPWFLALALLGITAQDDGWLLLATLVLMWFLHNSGRNSRFRAPPRMWRASPCWASQTWASPCCSSSRSCRSGWRCWWCSGCPPGLPSIAGSR